MADLLTLYDRASAWTSSKVAGATNLDDPSVNEGWDVRTLLNHMLDTQRYFLGSARGEKTPLPSPEPPDVLSDQPTEDFQRAHDEMLQAYGAPGVIEKTGPALGIAFSDQLLHGWDLARSTGQDATMPDGLAEAAFEMLDGRLTDDQRAGAFKPELPVAPDASSQDRLLAYTGRTP